MVPRWLGVSSALYTCSASRKGMVSSVCFLTNWMSMNSPPAPESTRTVVSMVLRLEVYEIGMRIVLVDTTDINIPLT